MEKAVVEKMAASGLKKQTLLETDPTRYWLRSVLAGMYLSLVVLVFWSLAHNLSDSPWGKVISSAFFGVGLTIIVFTNSELFTSNNMYMAVSSVDRRTTWLQTAKLWTACWVGNFIGAIILGLLMWGAGVLDALPADHALYAGALHKAHQGALAIFIKGIFANWVVCLAVWTAFQMKEDIAKMVAIILIVFIFLYLGFEHSIANMGTFTFSLLGKGTLTLADAAFNLVFSTAGNIVGGGLFVGAAYAFLSPLKRDEAQATEAPAQAKPTHHASKAA